MKTLTLITKPLGLLVMGWVLAACLAGCSDDQPQQPAAPSANTRNAMATQDGHNPNPWDHSGEQPVSEDQRQQFAEQFAEQCLKREIANTGDNANVQQASRACHCVAQFMAKTLTPQEADKFLKEHENPHSLEIKYENAVYHCLQQKQPPHAPNFSRK